MVTGEKDLLKYMEALKKSIKNILEDNKAESIVMVDVKNKSSVTDIMFICLLYTSPSPRD